MTATVTRPASEAGRPAGATLRPAGGLALYEGTVRHRRSDTPPHAFEQSVSYAYLDLAALPDAFDRLPLWSARRPAPVRFRRRDYFDGGTGPIDDGVRSLVADRTGVRPGGPVLLLPQLRRAGWLFNPLSVYYCLTADERRVANVVLEVSNTPWGERCWYVASVDVNRPSGPWEFPKEMHVSPFLGMDLTHRLRAPVPGRSLTLRLEDRRGDALVFAADLTGRRVPLDRRRALQSALGHGLATWKVSASIYAHAVRLWIAGARVHRHPASRSDTDDRPAGAGGP
jgi:uncharacterized protein